MSNEMRKLITRLFDEAPQLDEHNPLIQAVRSKLPENARPVFLECQVVLKFGYSVGGVLTRTSEDTLRLVSPAKRPDNSVVMADHYFAYEDVLTIIVGRDMPRSSVIQPSPRNGSSPLIIG